MFSLLPTEIQSYVQYLVRYTWRPNFVGISLRRMPFELQVFCSTIQTITVCQTLGWDTKMSKTFHTALLTLGSCYLENTFDC